MGNVDFQLSQGKKPLPSPDKAVSKWNSLSHSQTTYLPQYRTNVSRRNGHRPFDTNPIVFQGSRSQNRNEAVLLSVPYLVVVIQVKFAFFLIIFPFAYSNLRVTRN